ncbi:MAG TPA: hypothetical protein VFC90_13210 [Planctomycetota bacterium]|nr:hypothetical protein [Planctomycetota bacterium]
MDQTESPGQAEKILEREGKHIDAFVAERRGRPASPAEAIAAVEDVFNLRRRYFGATGEHFGLLELEGIRLIDALDERLLRGIRELLKAFVEAHPRRIPDLKLLGMLADKMAAGSRPMPQYPIAFMVLFTIRSHFERFQEIVTAKPDEVPELEHALVHHLLGVADRYVQTRERPVMRHFSDVAREYSVVSRLKCPCGEEKYEVKTQSLCQRSDGSPYDRLDLQCRACGARRSIAFDLPHFKDMYQV